uniref:Uncharacterized protein n=1 Tax=Arundo donax TaxID=35708 RepID=A0A0A9AZM1_ARUDO
MMADHDVPLQYPTLGVNPDTNVPYVIYQEFKVPAKKMKQRLEIGKNVTPYV